MTMQKQQNLLLVILAGLKKIVRYIYRGLKFTTFRQRKAALRNLLRYVMKITTHDPQSAGAVVLRILQF